MASNAATGWLGRGVAVLGAKMYSCAAKPAGMSASSNVGRPDGPKCAASMLRRPVKCTTRYSGRKVAKEASRRTAKMADARSEVAMVVYGSVRIERLRRLL